MTDKKPSPSLEDLDARLRRARERRPDQDAEKDQGPNRNSIGAGLGFALRIGIELVAALAVGVAIGYGLDRWLGTGPWLMIAFFFLGSAAGFLNVYRAVSGYGYAAGYRRDSDREKEGPQRGSSPDSDT
jgi:ATP synthase protein I